jgi:hypothetical protein
MLKICSVPVMRDQSSKYKDSGGLYSKGQSAPNSRADSAPEIVRDFLDAVNALGGENDFILAGLTEFLHTQKPVAKDGLSKQQEQYLIETGTFTGEELAEVRLAIYRGSFQLSAAEAWLSHLCATLSLDQAAGFLEWTEADVRTAVFEGHLHAVEIAGRLRFPDWQFCLGAESKLLPGLDKVLDALVERWSWIEIAAFFATPQRSLITAGRQTPVEWLRTGNSPEAVRVIIEASDWL